MQQQEQRQMRGFFASLRMTNVEGARQMWRGHDRRGGGRTNVWGIQCVRLAEGGVDFFVVVGGFEDFAGLGAVGGADEAVALHHVDEVGGATVANP